MKNVPDSAQAIAKQCLSNPAHLIFCITINPNFLRASAHKRFPRLLDLRLLDLLLTAKSGMTGIPSPDYCKTVHALCDELTIGGLLLICAILLQKTNIETARVFGKAHAIWEGNL
jgi:hypothetical protein